MTSKIELLQNELLDKSTIKNNNYDNNEFITLKNENKLLGNELEKEKSRSLEYESILRDLERQYASLGNDMIRNYERTLSDVNRLNYVLDRWTGEGTSNSVPRVTTAATNNNVLSDYFVEDASFLRIQNIQLGYSFSDNLINKVGLTKLRLYTSVNNVYTFTKYRGFDPAATNGSPIGGGIDYGFYPTPRTFILGINANF